MNLKIVLRDVSAKTGKGNIKFGIHIKGHDRTFIATDIYIEPKYFDIDSETIKKTLRHAVKLNAELFAQKERFLSYYEDLGGSMLVTTPKELKNLLQVYDKISSKNRTTSISNFTGVLDKIIYDLNNEVTGESTSRKSYAGSFRSVRALLVKFFKTESILFQSIDRQMLVELRRFYLKMGKKESTFNNYLRLIRRVFNVAINEKLINSDLYPFRAFQIPSDYETEIRCLDAHALREFYKTSGIGRDMFFLSFFLCGMNMKDMFYMDYFEDHIDVRRLKTIRTSRAVKLVLMLQPEVLEILERYKDLDKTRLIKTSCRNTRALTESTNRHIRLAIDKMNKEGLNIPHFTHTYARHSWATIAGELGIPDSTIDKALMHSTTGKMIEKYRKYDYSQIDDANRKVIDHLLNKEETN